MEFPLITNGVIRYDPPRPGMKDGKFTHKGRATADTKFRKDWWCVIEINQGIGLGGLYRWFLDRHWYDVDRSPIKRDMVAPGWSLHISVVRGERPRNPEMWKHRDGEVVPIRYSPYIRQSGDTTGYDRSDGFFFLDSECEAFWDIRQKLGLQWQTYRGVPFSSHITIARLK